MDTPPPPPPAFSLITKIQKIGPFCNPTGPVAKHIVSVGLKIHIWSTQLFYWQYLALLNVDSFRNLLVQHF